MQRELEMEEEGPFWRAADVLRRGLCCAVCLSGAVNQLDQFAEARDGFGGCRRCLELVGTDICVGRRPYVHAHPKGRPHVERGALRLLRCPDVKRPVIGERPVVHAVHEACLQEWRRVAGFRALMCPVCGSMVERDEAVREDLLIAIAADDPHLVIRPFLSNPRLIDATLPRDRQSRSGPLWTMVAIALANSNHSGKTSQSTVADFLMHLNAVSAHNAVSSAR